MFSYGFHKASRQINHTATLSKFCELYHEVRSQRPVFLRNLKYEICVTQSAASVAAPEFVC